MDGLLFASPLPTLKHPSPSTQQSTIFLKAWPSCQFAMQARRKGEADLFSGMRLCMTMGIGIQSSMTSDEILNTVAKIMCL
jgi:hypothetical protein